MPRRGTEIEIKLRVADIATMRRKLRRMKARAQPRVFESNTLFDSSTNEIRNSGRMLRVRLERPTTGRAPRRANSRVRGLLTYKAPSRGSAAQELGLRYKEREEIEIDFHPAENLAAIFEGVGLRPNFRYEKFRTEFTLPRLTNLHLFLDETPVGNFLELEGPPAAIERPAHILGFTPQDYITGTYWDLHIADCRGRNIVPGDLVFKKRKK